MRLHVTENHIYLSAECEAEVLQIKDAITQLQRYKLAHQFWGGDSVHIYPKSHDQYHDELKSNK
jgi:hypothetical protein